MNKNTLLFIVSAVVGYSASADNNYKWIYNPYNQKCLYAPLIMNQKALVKDCDDNINFQWKIEDDTPGFFYSGESNLKCLITEDFEEGIVKVGRCKENDFYYHNTIDDIIYPGNNNDYCLSVNDNDEVELRSCDMVEDQIWFLWNTNPKKYYTDKTQDVWIYNPKLNKCLIVSNNYHRYSKPYIGDCNDSRYSKWTISTSGETFLKAFNGMCINVVNTTNGMVQMKPCNNESIFSDITSTKNQESIMSPLLNNKCLGLFKSSNSQETRVNMNDCDESLDDQHWIILSKNPNNLTKCGSGVGECPSGECCSKNGFCDKCHQSTTTTTISRTTTSIKPHATPTNTQFDDDDNETPKWIYNKFNGKCLYAQKQLNKVPLLKECENNLQFNWYVPKKYKEGYIQSVANTKRCLNIPDTESGELLVNSCTSSKTFKFDEGIIYFPSISDEYCVSVNENENIKLEECEMIDEQYWSVWDRNPKEIFDVKTQTVWIYNKELNKCLRSAGYFSIPTIADCEDANRLKWEVPVSGDGFYRSINKNLCLNFENINEGKIVMGECNNEAVISDINSSYNKASIISPLDESKCLGVMDSNNSKVSMNNCDKNRKDQVWEIRTSNPNNPKEI